MKLHILQGLPGSGKSTLARQLSIQDYAVILSTDDLCFVGHEYDFRAELAADRHLRNQARCEYFLSKHVSVVIDNTNIRNLHAKPYVIMGLNAGAEILFHRCSGGYKSVHNVPESTLQKMRESLEVLSIDAAIGS